MSWTREQVAILINEYKNYPCLYAVKHKLYQNRHARQTALSKIQDVLLRNRPDTTINDIKVKFGGLKATFLSEYKKRKDSLKSGAGEDEVYHPTLWYYGELTFILDHVEPRQSFDALDFEDSQMYNDDAESNNVEANTGIYYINEETGYLEGPELDDDINRSSSRGSTQSATSDINKSSCTSTKYVGAKKQKRKAVQSTSESVETVMSAATNTLEKLTACIGNSQQTPNVRIDSDRIFSEFILSQLQRITDEDVRLDIEEKVTGILYEGIRQSRKK